MTYLYIPFIGICRFIAAWGGTHLLAFRADFRGQQKKRAALAGLMTGVSRSPMPYR